MALAATGANKIYKPFNRSSRSYHAMKIIIRSKIRGPADAENASFNRALIFDAIRSRLYYSVQLSGQFTSSSKHSLRQGNLTILQYYDKVDKILPY